MCVWGGGRWFRPPHRGVPAPTGPPWGPLQGLHAMATMCVLVACPGLLAPLKALQAVSLEDRPLALRRPSPAPAWLPSWRPTQDEGKRAVPGALEPLSWMAQATADFSTGRYRLWTHRSNLTAASPTSIGPPHRPRH
jgi:hypothetical protein